MRGRPNFLVIYTDQQRADAFGAAGNAAIHTPNLDRLAASGTRFARAFVQNPLCMPSRISMLSGRYPHDLRITEMGVPVPQDLEVVSHRLGRVGYATANLGKLHFLPHANRDHRTPHPAYGFDEVQIADEPGVYDDAYLAYVRAADSLAGAVVRMPLPPARATWEQLMGQDPGAVPRDDYAEIVAFPADDHLTHTAFVAERTIEYLRRASGPRPFFCVAGFYSPHPPLRVPQTFLDLYDRAELAIPDNVGLAAERAGGRFSDDQLRLVAHGYYAMVSEVDHHVGRIMAALAESGHGENTVVVFTSDHGEWLGDGLRYAKGYPGDDPVSQVPLVFAGAGVESGHTVTDLVEAVDIVPTLLDLAAVPVDPALSGQPLTAALQGQGPVGRQSALTEGTDWVSIRTDEHRYLVDGELELLTLADGTPVDDDGLVSDHRGELVGRLLQARRCLPRTFPY